MFGELWTKDTIMTDMDRETEEEILRHTLFSSPLKNYIFKTKEVYSKHPGTQEKWTVQNHKVTSNQGQILNQRIREVSFARWRLKYTCNSLYPSLYNRSQKMKLLKKNIGGTYRNLEGICVS